MTVSIFNFEISNSFIRCTAVKEVVLFAAESYGSQRHRIEVWFTL